MYFVEYKDSFLYIFLIEQVITKMKKYANNTSCSFLFVSYFRFTQNEKPFLTNIFYILLLSKR